MGDAASRPWRLLIVGAPGSGKGTQAARLCDRLGIPAISTGEMLRDAMASESELGKRVESIVQSGALVNDQTMEQVLAERLGESDALRGFLLDGYPRTEEQVAALDRILGAQDAALDLVLFLDVPEDELMRRALGRGRADDTEEVIRHRIQVYRNQTEPIVAIYRERDLVASLDGRGSVDQVAENAWSALEEVA